VVSQAALLQVGQAAVAMAEQEYSQLVAENVLEVAQETELVVVV
jgi:hypothetical protein